MAKRSLSFAEETIEGIFNGIKDMSDEEYCDALEEIGEARDSTASAKRVEMKNEINLSTEHGG